MSVYAKVWAYDQHPLQIDKEGTPKKGTRNPAAKAVLVALAEFPGVGQRECWPAQATLALMTDFEERTVRKHLDALEKQGFISRRERRSKGRRLTDMVTLLGPLEAFGPRPEPPERGAAGGDEPPESDAKSHRNVVPGNRHKEEPSLKNSSKDEEASASPGTFAAFLREELEGEIPPLTKNREDRYAGEFNKLIKKSVDDDVLYKACDRIVERWTGDEHRKLTAEQALEDVVNGKPPKHVSEPARLSASARKAGYEWLFEEKPEDKRDLDAELKRLRESA